MKKKVLTFILFICFIFPLMFCLSACNNKNKVTFIVDGQVYSTVETAGNEEMCCQSRQQKQAINLMVGIMRGSFKNLIKIL